MSQFKPLPPIQELQQAFDYDPATGIFRNKYTRGSRAKQGGITGTVNKNGYLVLTHKRRLFRASRLAWYLMTGVDPLELNVDHIDKNTINNAFSNLRLATTRQNQGNRLAKGWTRIGNRYQVQIRIGEKQVHVGLYATPEEAHEVYVAKHIELHGQFSPYCATLTESNT